MDPDDGSEAAASPAARWWVGYPRIQAFLERQRRPRQRIPLHRWTDLTRMWEMSGSGTTVLGRHLLRHAVYVVLAEAPGPLRVAEIVARLEERGYVTLRSSPSRAVSDVLRTEVEHERVVRRGRGLYEVVEVDQAHLRYVERVLSELHLAPNRRYANGSPFEVAWWLEIADDAEGPDRPAA